MNLEECIERVDFFHIGKKTTVCLLTLKNGFEIVSSSACLNEMVYKEDVGKAIAKELALQKLYEYLTVKKALEYKNGETRSSCKCD